VRLHKADVDEKAQEVLQSESPTEHHGYWDVVSATKTLHRLASFIRSTAYCRFNSDLVVNFLENEYHFFSHRRPINMFTALF
jgi:hypothetical protein